MKNSYDSLNDTFNTDPVEETDIVKEERRNKKHFNHIDENPISFESYHELYYLD